MTAGEALDQHQAEGVDVARGGGRLTEHLLRAQVGDRAEEGADRGHPCAVDEAGDPEIRELRAHGGTGEGHEHIGRLDVAVDDPALVDVCEPRRDLGADRGQHGGRERQQVAEVVAVDQLHHEVGRILAAARRRVVQRDE
ncbi:hypothetical protein GCM10025866_00670 [Naasia aerilata]|uniref:Uncharacterized protein n=1 Tax=Naasia aerilata TaxID=1162966 RepID=A0ABN6XGY8_9MICO|nr:hypothetical protein GCM10025866_00670 [Naasia aerilata]